MEPDEIRSIVDEVKNEIDVLRIYRGLDGGLTEREFLHIGRVTGAIWRHDGNLKKPHVRLESGLCSNHYFDVGKILTYSNIGWMLAKQLLSIIEKKLGMRLYREVDWVITSDHSGVPLARDMSHLVDSWNDFTVRQTVVSSLAGKRSVTGCQRWNRSQMAEGSRVLHIEDIVTTFDTAKMVRAGIREDNPYSVTFLPVLGTIVHRPKPAEVLSTRKFEDGDVVSIFHFPTESWPKEECPLHAVGSEALDPRTEWDRLMA